MKKCRRSIAIILSVALIVCMFPASIFAGTSKAQKNYLYMGDSMSYNFVTVRHDYSSDLPKGANYPYKVAKKIGLNVLNNDSQDDFTIGGVRALDIYAALTPGVKGDGYTKVNCGDFSNQAIDRNKGKVENADVISIQLGHSNISPYAIGEIANLLGLGAFASEEAYGHSLDQLFTKEELEKVKPLIQECIKSMGLAKMGIEKAIQNIDPKQKKKIHKELVDALGEDFVSSVESIAPKVKGLVDVLVYSLVSAMVGFDNLIDRIYEINPKADIYVMGLFNPAKNMNITYKISEKKSIKIPVGKILGSAFDMINKYYEKYAQYSYKYHYVTPLNNVQVYGDILGNSKNAHAKKVMTELLTALFNDESYLPIKGQEERYEVASAAAKELAPGVMKLLSTRSVEITDFVEGLSDTEYLNKLARIANVTDLEETIQFYRDAVALDKKGNFVNKEKDRDRAVLHVLVAVMLDGVYIHPTEKGHDQLTRHLYSAMKVKSPNYVGIRYHDAQKDIERVSKVVKTASKVAASAVKTQTSVINKLIKMLQRS